MGPVKVSYNSNLDADEQISSEEEIAFLLFEETELDEEECTDLSRRVLAIVLARFRPDLVIAEVE
jgi:hypothetical protein